MGRDASSCRAPQPAPIARCEGEGVLTIIKDFENSNQTCHYNVTDPSVAVCSPQERGLAYLVCVGEETVDRELSVTLPAIETVICDGDFEQDEFPGRVYQSLLLFTSCGDDWVSKDDSCSAMTETTDTGEPVCFSGDVCETNSEGVCIASLPSLTVTSTGHLEAECAYPIEYPTDPPTPAPEDPTPTTDLAPSNPPTEQTYFATFSGLGQGTEEMTL
jgi:hypothetical protein